MTPALPSLFLSADKAEALAAWRSSEPDVVSLHLPLDQDGHFPAVFDRLVREGDDPLVRKLPQDVDLLSAFLRDFAPMTRRGLCAYSCAKYGLFEAFAAPEPLRASLTAAERPWLHPLSNLRAQYRRFLVLLADADRGRFFELHLGETHELGAVSGGPAKLIKRAAQLRAARRTDLFVLGAGAEAAAAISPLLSQDLRDGLILEPDLGPDRPNAAVADSIALKEREGRRVRESVLVERFLDHSACGEAVAGLEAAALALQEGRVKALLVQDGYAKMGRRCPACGRLSVDHRSCPWCFKTTEPVFDLVSELADRATAAGVEVFCVSRTETRFDAAGRIGVVLHVAAPRRAVVPAGRALRALYALKDGRVSPLRPDFA